MGELFINTKTNKTMKLISNVNVRNYKFLNVNLNIKKDFEYTTNKPAYDISNDGNWVYYIQELGCYVPTSWFRIHPAEFAIDTLHEQNNNKALNWWTGLPYHAQKAYYNKYYFFKNAIHNMTKDDIYKIWLKEGNIQIESKPIKPKPIVQTQVVHSYSITNCHQSIKEMIEKGYELVSMIDHGCSVLVVFNKPKIIRGIIHGEIDI